MGTEGEMLPYLQVIRGSDHWGGCTLPARLGQQGGLQLGGHAHQLTLCMPSIISPRSQAVLMTYWWQTPCMQVSKARPSHIKRRPTTPSMAEYAGRDTHS